MLQRMRLGTLAKAGFGFVSLLALVLGATGVVATRAISRRLDQITETRVPMVHALGELRDAEVAVAEGERGLINRRMMSMEGVRRSEFAWLDEHWGQADQAWDALERLPKSAE